MITIPFLSLVLMGSSLLTSAHSLALGDPFTCPLEETFMATRNTTVQRPISVKSYEWCLRVPPRCTIYRTEWRSVVETEVVPMRRTSVGCCPGYKLNTEHMCAPFCSSGCFSRSCIAPEICGTRRLLTSPFVTSKPLRDRSKTSTTGTTTRPIEGDYDLQIEDSLITVTKQNSETKNISTITTPLTATVMPSTDPSSVVLTQGYKFSISTISPYKATYGKSLPKTSTSPIPAITKPTREEEGLPDSVSKTLDIAVVKDPPEESEDSKHQNVSQNILVTNENMEHDLDASRTIVETDMMKKINEQPSQVHNNLYNATNTTVRRDPLKYRTSLENKRTDNDTTYSKAPQMILSDRLLYSIGISVGVMFAIIMVTLVITKHQHYLQEVDPRCGNTRNSKKCKAAHKAEEQETTLHVVHYQVTREITTNQPIADCETTRINSTRNSTITVYNFPAPANTFDVPLRPAVRPFGDYDFPSPMAENVYDEIPAHRDTGEGIRCFVRQ